MVKEGIPFVAIPLSAAAVLFFFHFWVIGIIFVGLALFMAYFFRDPKRSIPEADNVVVSAADGRVTRIDENGSGKLVSVFLSPLDVHINRAPIAGTIQAIEYVSGKKKPAMSEDASFVNERNSLTIVGDRMTVVCTQIAGIMARRIVCWKKVGDRVTLGEKFGLIKFGSRTDLLMPGSVVVKVKVGDRVVGGETIIAELT
jgi:phosphatidylserine decarboxylase